MDRVQDANLVKAQADLDSMTQGFARLAHHLTDTELKLKVSILSDRMRSRLQTPVCTDDIVNITCLVCHWAPFVTVNHVNLSSHATYSRQAVLHNCISISS